MQPEILSKSLEIRTRGLDTQRTVDFIASTDALDSYEEIVEQDWDLARFKANPIILYGHQSRDLPIGKATRVEVVSVNGRRQLETTIEFVTEKANPKAEQVWQLIKEGVLKAVSVGFVPRDARYEKRDGREVFVLGSPELHEISVVPIPANPEALAKMKQRARATKYFDIPGGRCAIEIGAGGGGGGGGAANELGQTIADVARAAGTLKPGETTVYGNTGASMRLAANGDIHIRASGASNEDNMKTIEEYAAALAKSNAELELTKKQLDDHQKEGTSLKTAVSTFEGTVKQLTADRDSWKDRAEKSEGVLVESEVESLVGKKISPAQKGEFLELRKTSPDLFKRMVAALPDMKLLAGQVVSGAAGSAPAVVTGEAGNGAALATKIFGA